MYNYIKMSSSKQMTIFELIQAYFIPIAIGIITAIILVFFPNGPFS